MFCSIHMYKIINIEAKMPSRERSQSNAQKKNHLENWLFKTPEAVFLTRGIIRRITLLHHRVSGFKKSNVVDCSAHLSVGLFGLLLWGGVYIRRTFCIFKTVLVLIQSQKYL